MKWIKRLCSFIFLCLFLVVAFMLWRGYGDCQDALKKMSVQQMGAQIQAKEDYTTLDQLPKDYIDAVLVGCETALWLAQQGKQVTIVEALDKLLAVNGPLCHANSEMLEALIPFHQVQVVTNAKVQRFENGVLTAQMPEGVHTLEADDVVLCVGYKEEDSLYKELEFSVSEIYCLGDARKVANIMYAIWDAFEVANHL